MEWKYKAAEKGNTQEMYLKLYLRTALWLIVLNNEYRPLDFIESSLAFQRRIK